MLKYFLCVRMCLGWSCVVCVEAGVVFFVLSVETSFGHKNEEMSVALGQHSSFMSWLTNSLLGTMVAGRSSEQIQAASKQESSSPSLSDSCLWLPAQSWLQETFLESRME